MKKGTELKSQCHAEFGGMYSYIFVFSVANCMHKYFFQACHLSRDQTLQKITSSFYWKNMNDEICTYVK